MTLSRFEKLLKKVNPKLRLRHGGYGDVIGLYGGSKYICRLSKGELNLHGYREVHVDPKRPWIERQGNIKKRGRKTVINLLRNYRYIEDHKLRSMLTWGINYGNGTKDKEKSN